MATWTISDALSTGWKAMKDTIGMWIGILIVLALASVIPEIFRRWDGLHTIVSVIFLLVSLILALGVYRVALNIVDRKPASFEQLFSQIKLFPDYLIGTILYCLIVLGGLILLIVPGIIWAVKYQYYGYLIVDKGMSPFDAIKRSGQVTMGHKWRLFGLFWANLGVNILGAIALLVGLFVTIPTTIIASTSVYRTLEAAAPKWTTGTKPVAKTTSAKAPAGSKPSKAAKKKR
jgi:uncharacterized membrane protein